MIFSGLYLLGEVAVPDVIIHSTVLAWTAGGCRSRSARESTRSTSVDKHGTDATATDCSKISSTQDVRFSWGAIEKGGKLTNKLWNVRG